MATEWFCNISGRQLGPLSSQQLKAMVDDGRLRPEHRVRRGPQGSWISAAQVTGLFATSADAALEPAAAPLGRPPEDAAPKRPAQATPPLRRRVKPGGPPVAEPVAQPPAASQVRPAQAPAPQQPPGLPPPPAAAQPGSGGAAGFNRFSVATEASAPTARAIGRSSSGTVALSTKRRKDIVVVGWLIALVIGLAVAGIVLAVVSRSPKKAITNEREPDTAKRADAPPARAWVDASKSAVRRGAVRTRISSTRIGVPRLVHASGRAARPKRACLLIAVELENINAERKLNYASWGGDRAIRGRVKLSDNSGKTYRQKSFSGFSVDGQLTSAPLDPKRQVRDLLVFEPPPETAECLLLELPAAAFRASGALYFRIPREMIVAAKEEPDWERPLRRGGETAEPAKRDASEISRPVAEQQPEENADVPDIFKDYPQLRGEDEAGDEDFSLEGKFDSSQPSPKGKSNKSQERSNRRAKR